MPRKPAAAALTVVAQIPGHGRPEPPADLTAREQAIWHDVVAGMPAHWFGAATYPMLRSYCTHAVAAEILGAEYTRVLTTHGTAVEDVDRLSRLYAAETAALALAATKLRIAPRSMSRIETADAAIRNAPTRRLWERNLD